VIFIKKPETAPNYVYQSDLEPSLIDFEEALLLSEKLQRGA